MTNILYKNFFKGKLYLIAEPAWSQNAAAVPPSRSLYSVSIEGLSKYYKCMTKINNAINIIHPKLSFQKILL